MGEDRLQYLTYRCIACGALLTKLEIIARWEAMEAAQDGGTAICECGGRQVRWTNPTPEEIEKYSTKWQWFRYVILRRNDRMTKLWKLYYRCVKGKSLKELGTAYDPDAPVEPEPPK